MKGRKRLLLSFFILIVIICSVFVVAIEYQLLGGATIEKDKQALLVKIFSDDNSGTIPFKVNFSSLVLYHTGRIDYRWDFGDNITSNEIYPIHIYNETGTYDCTLTVTDSTGKASSDRVEIIVRENEAPIVTIFISELQPNRPFIPIIRRKIISYNYDGENFRRIIESRFFPKFLLGVGSFLSCEASASSTEGNEIVSYKWELRPPTYTKLTGVQDKPVYTFEGKNITIPTFYIYPQAPYDLTVIVTDSKGQVGTSTIKFETQVHSIEDMIFTIKDSIKFIRKDLWHDIFKSSFEGPIARLIFDIIFELFPGLSISKILLILVLTFNWDLSPDESVKAGIIARFLDKHQITGNLVRNVFNKIISILNNRKQKSSRPEILDIIMNALEIKLESWGLKNKRPVISNESPEDKRKLVPTDIPEVAITVKDPENDTFGITIHGKYVNNITKSNQNNDTFIALLKTPLPNLVDIKWHVNVSYSQNKWVNATYSFKTW